MAEEKPETKQEEAAKKLLEEISTGRRVWELNGKTYITRFPSVEQSRMGDFYYAQAFSSAISNPDVSKRLLANSKILQWLNENEIWTEETQKKFDELGTQMAELEEQLTKFDEAAPNDTAREIATKLSATRYMRFLMSTELNSYLTNSAENKAEEIKNDYLVSVCTYNEDETSVWEKYEIFGAERNALLVDKARYEYVTFTQRLSSDFVDEFPEKQYLDQAEEELKESIEKDAESTINEEERIDSVEEVGSKKSTSKNTRTNSTGSKTTNSKSEEKQTQ